MCTRDVDRDRPRDADVGGAEEVVAVVGGLLVMAGVEDSRIEA